MQEVNEYILKLSSAGISLPEALENSKRYMISTEIDIVEVTDKDMQDGTINRIYKGKSNGEVNILTEGKQIIKAKAKSKVSKSIHGAIWYYHNQLGLEESFESYYERMGKKMALYMPEIIKFLDTKS